VKVLVVCSGNICRSPMAAEYLRHRAAHDGLSHLVVDSAGTLGIHGAPVPRTCAAPTS
jgi:protein-tyrosine phosphatase